MADREDKKSRSGRVQNGTEQEWGGKKKWTPPVEQLNQSCRMTAVSYSFRVCCYFCWKNPHIELENVGLTVLPCFTSFNKCTVSSDLMLSLDIKRCMYWSDSHFLITICLHMLSIIFQSTAAWPSTESVWCSVWSLLLAGSVFIPSQ